jgi:hypothetical protein
MIIYKNNIFNIIIFFIINLFIKIIPLWTLRNNKSYNIQATLILFFIYLFWLYLNNTNFYVLNKMQLENIRITLKKEVKKIRNFGIVWRSFPAKARGVFLAQGS